MYNHTVWNSGYWWKRIKTRKRKKIMEDQLTIFETAKLAKEKGFNIPARFYYNQKHNKVDYSLETTSIVDNEYIQSFTNLLDYSAPTQSLLQKWLREQHNIDIYIKRIGLISYEINVFRLGDSKSERKNRGSNWENLLEWGLLEALELIK